jgi:hypothetical protein
MPHAGSLLLDTFRTVVPAAAFGAPSGAALRGLTLLEAHMGSFQPVMLYDWLRANLPSVLSVTTLAGGRSSSGGVAGGGAEVAGVGAAADAPAAAAAAALW